MFLSWLKNKVTKPSEDTNRVTVKSEPVKINIDKTTVDYILNKYKKEMNKFLSNYHEKNLQNLVDEPTMEILLKFMSTLLAIINDDYLIGHKILKHKIVSMDKYVFSQYRKEAELKDNIYKLLVLIQKLKFSSNVRENLLEHISFFNYMGLDIYGLLRDYYDFLMELEKNHKIVEYLHRKHKFEDRIRDIDHRNLTTLLKRII